MNPLLAVADTDGGSGWAFHALDSTPGGKPADGQRGGAARIKEAGDGVFFCGDPRSKKITSPYDAGGKCHPTFTAAACSNIFNVEDSVVFFNQQSRRTRVLVGFAIKVASPFLSSDSGSPLQGPSTNYVTGIRNCDHKHPPLP